MKRQSRKENKAYFKTLSNQEYVQQQIRTKKVEKQGVAMYGRQ